MLDFLVNNDVLSAIVAFALVLIPAVLIHELGHFLAAKLVGITILEFGIGMPPRMVKLFSYRGTDYTLNWLPLGGFVRPLGEDMVRQLGNEAAEVDREEAERRGVKKTMSVNEAPALGRIFFMAAGAMANFLLAFVLFVIIALSGLPQRVGGVVGLDYISPGAALAQAGLQPGDAIQTINGENFTDASDLINRLYAANGEPVTLKILRKDVAGPMEFTLTPSLTGETVTSESHPIVLSVSAGSPAATAGLQANDLILAFNGEALSSYEELQGLTAAHLDEEVTLTVWRTGEAVDLSLTPRSAPPTGEGAMGIGISTAALNPAVGIVYEEAGRNELIPQPLDRAVEYSVGRIAEVVNTIISIPGQILNGTAESSSLRFTSPLGISQVGGFFLQESIQRDQPNIIIEFMALISLALGLTNLLPIPALDGGRILFVLIELVRGRPIAPEREGMVHLVGLALLLSLMVVVLLNDIANPLTDLLR
ncbi:MAG: RIP metalloprotease RseP [Chloroflexota bacterium]